MKRVTAQVEDSADSDLPHGDEDATTWSDLIGWMALLLLVASVVWRHWP